MCTDLARDAELQEDLLEERSGGQVHAQEVSLLAGFEVPNAMIEREGSRRAQRGYVHTVEGIKLDALQLCNLCMNTDILRSLCDSFCRVLILNTIKTDTVCKRCLILCRF